MMTVADVQAIQGDEALKFWFLYVELAIRDAIQFGQKTTAALHLSNYSFEKIEQFATDRGFRVEKKSTNNPHYEYGPMVDYVVIGWR